MKLRSEMAKYRHMSAWWPLCRHMSTVWSLTTIFIFLIFVLLNSVYTVLPLSQGLDRAKGGTIHMETVKYADRFCWYLCVCNLSPYL